MPLGPSPLERLNRARADLRMGVPVVLAAAGRFAIVVAAEELGADRLAALRALGPVTLAITVRRAETLKARAYDGDLARIVVPEDVDLDWLRGVADPADDLRAPMKGPLNSQRDGDAGLHRFAIQLAKSAHLLPAALVVPIQDGAGIARQEGLTFLDLDLVAPEFARAARLHPVIAARVPCARPRPDACMSSAPRTEGKNITRSRSADRRATSPCWRDFIRPVSPATCWAV